MSDSKEFAVAKVKLERLLNLSDEICSYFPQCLDKLNDALSKGEISLSMRNNVLIGLALKALGSFETLVFDARIKRAECSHHLKTMVEAFIYYHWVSKDNGDGRARLVQADGYRAMVVYHENDTISSNAKQYAKEWLNLKNKALDGMEKEWKEFKGQSLEMLADSCGLSGHYKRIYRMSCEAAHIADLFIYLPPEPEGKLSLAPEMISTLRCYVCLKFGIYMAIDLLADASDILKLSLGDKIKEFKLQLEAIEKTSQ